MELSQAEHEYLEAIAQAFTAGQFLKLDHPLTPLLVRRGVVRTNGQYVMLTSAGVDLLKARGYQGRLPTARADSATAAQKGDKRRPLPGRLHR